MSWSPDLFIGELRPWPDSVHVVRGKTDEVRRYTPERKDAQEVLTRRIDELCAENERLRQENQSIGMAAYELGRASMADENAKLREELAKARDPQRIGGQADPNSFVYAIEQLREFRWQHATNDEDAIPYINNVAAAHERENAKLRELCRDIWRSAYVDAHYGARLADRMRELGVEVD